MTYAKQLRIRSGKHLEHFLELNTNTKDFKRYNDPMTGTPLDLVMYAHKFVNLAYEQLLKESLSEHKRFNPRWTTVHNVKMELVGQIHERFNKLQGHQALQIETSGRPNL